jgi:hypothetical protein
VSVCDPLVDAVDALEEFDALVVLELELDELLVWGLEQPASAKAAASAPAATMATIPFLFIDVSLRGVVCILSRCMGDCFQRLDPSSSQRGVSTVAP